MRPRVLVLTAICVAFIGLATLRYVAAAPATKEVTNVAMMTHIQMKLPEQDVFINLAGKPDSEVYRIEGDQSKDAANLAATAYASSSTVPHDPFKTGTNPLGPYTKGQSLGFTMAQWLDGSGSGTYTIDGSTASIDLSFHKLVPSGTYTLWCSRINFPPNFSVTDKPCGAADGSLNMFKADSSGDGAIKVTTDALAASTDTAASVLAVAYHSDGQSHGADPGEFGLNSHVQLAFLLPAPTQATATTASGGGSQPQATSAPAGPTPAGLPATGEGASTGESGGWWLVAIAGLLALLGGIRVRRSLARA